MDIQRNTFKKAERLNSRTLIEKLFAGGNKSMPAFPMRVVYMPVDSEKLPTASILISVPKKRFKRAVKRNLVKRQVREAYRKNKHILTDALEAREMKMALGFIWLDNNLHTTEEVETKMIKLLQLIAERL